MLRTRGLLGIGMFTLVAVACRKVEPREQREAPPADDGVYGFANGCFQVEGFDGGEPLLLTTTNSRDGYVFVRGPSQEAERFVLRATDLGVYLLFDSDERYFSATQAEGHGDASSGAWRFERPKTLDSDILLLDDDFRSPAEWELSPSTRDPERYRLKHYPSGEFLTLDGLSPSEAKAAVITLLPAEGCAEFPELSLDASGSVKPRTWDDGDVWGIAEIHSHMMSNFGFGGGGIFHGSPFHRLGVEHALGDCEPFHGPGGRRDIVGSFYDGSSEFDTESLLPILTSGESPEFNHATEGYPSFTDWPKSWARSTHQTMYYRWLERAYLGGLRLLVQHATGNSVLCELVIGVTEQKVRYSCNDMVSVDRAIEEMRNLERYIDAQSGGPGEGWLRIVESPKEARDVVNDGKLAVVLGIEISNLFDCFSTPRQGFEACTPQSVRASLDRVRDLGVRVIFPVHKYDNAFSAGDGSSGIIELGNLINSGHYSSFSEDCPGLSTSFDRGDVTFGGLNKPRAEYDASPPFDMSGFGDDVLGTLLPLLGDIQKPALEGNYCQSHGMTALGETLTLELMRRGMIIDIAHLPQRSMLKTYELLEMAGYPATKTHGGTDDGRVYRTGGMAGADFGRCADPDETATLARGYLSRVQEATDNGAYPSEALSFDLNGFAGGPRPRFGDDTPCEKPQGNPMTYPFKSYDGEVTFEQPTLGTRRVDFNTEGMIHIGLLPEVIEDVRRDGVTDKQLEPLFRSVEAYIRLWERAEKIGKELSK